MATVSNFSASFCLLLTLFGVVEAGGDNSYLDAWWFIWMSVLLCLICGCGGGASYYRRRAWQQQQMAAEQYQQQYQTSYPRSYDQGIQGSVYVVDVSPGVGYIYPRSGDVTNGPPLPVPPMTSLPAMRTPVKPPPYQPRGEDQPQGAPPAYRDAMQMPQLQPQGQQQQQPHEQQQQNQQSTASAPNVQDTV
ncbi:hypothetical protein LSAT2_031900 [Lamellibrachia satsuma]|nr:hypothetical protein LSAT2_031900 [Lamellibrachia satsuma]